MKPSPKLLAGALALALAGAAHALPTLQLGIQGGTYAGNPEETVFAPSGTHTFTLYAYLTPGNGAKQADIAKMLADSYALSIAVVPKTTTLGANLGSFLFNGSAIAVTADMTYGTPPLDDIAGADHDGGDLGSHGIFDTHFWERSFKFSSAAQTTPFNTAEQPGKDPTTGGTGMYYVGFAIDVSQLDKTAALHFDLYNKKLIEECEKKGKGKDKEAVSCTLADVDAGLFAPFSHDAQSGKGGGGIVLPPVTSVPEPGSLALIGLSLFGLASLRRRPGATP